MDYLKSSARKNVRKITNRHQSSNLEDASYTKLLDTAQPLVPDGQLQPLNSTCFTAGILTEASTSINKPREDRSYVKDQKKPPKVSLTKSKTPFSNLRRRASSASETTRSEKKNTFTRKRGSATRPRIGPFAGNSKLSRSARYSVSTNDLDKVGGADASIVTLIHNCSGAANNPDLSLLCDASCTLAVVPEDDLADTLSTASNSTGVGNSDSTVDSLNSITNRSHLDNVVNNENFSSGLDDDELGCLTGCDGNSTLISRQCDSGYSADSYCDSTHLITPSTSSSQAKVSAVKSLFPTGVLPANLINPLKSTPVHSEQVVCRPAKMTSTSNLFDKFRRRATRSKIFSSLRGRNVNRMSDSAKDSTKEVDKNTSLTRSATDEDPEMSSLRHPVCDSNADSNTITLRQSVPNSNTWSLSDLSPDKTVTRPCFESLLDVGIITPPTQFRVLVTPSEPESDGLSSNSSRSRKISSDLKKEIELSLLHWPSNVEHAEQSCNSLKRNSSGSNTLPEIGDSSRGLSLPFRNSGRPLSWSFDKKDASNVISVTTSMSNNSLGRNVTRAADSVSRCSTYASSCTTTEDLDLLPADDSYSTLASEEFGDALTALQSFSGRKGSYTRDSRRMSQPHPIKMRNHLPSKVSATSLNNPQLPQQHTRRRSKSEPPRLVHYTIRQNFSKDLAKICSAVGDIASLELSTHRHMEQRSLTIADPLWHHVTNEPEELSFRVGDIIMVLDKSDKDWWLGRRSTSPAFSPEESTDQQETGWFPSTFVRLRANQIVTTDELLEDIKQGTANTASVVQQYGSSLLSRDQARCNVINEILTAEREYVKHVQDIVEGFKGKATERTDMFTERQVALIFGNISEIFEVAKDFLGCLEITIAPCKSMHLALVGNCFLHHKERFAIYSPYCNNHPRALEELQKLKKDSKYTHFFEACRLLQNMIELPLDGFLLTPIQKICKYPLQLGELLKYTNPEHEDYKHLQEALAAMKDIAMLINERKRKLESIQKVTEWQSSVDDWQGEDLLTHSSELIHSGELSKLSSSGRLVDRHFFLFDHQLVQCKKELLKKSLIYKSRVLLDNNSVVSVEDGKVSNSSTHAKNAFEIRDQDGNCVLFLSAKSPADKEKWLMCFQKEEVIVQYDKDSGFVVTESFMALAKLSTPKASKPSKTNSLTRSEGKTGVTIMDNNNKLPIKQKSGNGLIHKLKRARITT